MRSTRFDYSICEIDCSLSAFCVSFEDNNISCTSGNCLLTDSLDFGICVAGKSIDRDNNGNISGR